MSKFVPYSVYKDPGADWIKKIPKDWRLAPMWTMFTRVKRTGFHDEELLSVYRDYGVIPKSSRSDNFNKASEDLSTYQLVCPGDLAVNKMKAWQGSLAISGIRGIVSPAYFVYRGHHSSDSRYVHYLLRSALYAQLYMSRSKGVRVNQWDIDPDAFSRMEVLQPPVADQSAIATFLDQETNRMDTLIAKKSRFIELLQEKQQALITRAVTRSLNPDALMKDSGVEWIGDVPAHWNTARLRNLTTSISTGPFGTTLGKDDYVTDGIPVINPSHITDSGCSPDPEVTVSEKKAAQLTFWSLRAGDLITARRGELGRSAVIRQFEEGWICGTGSARIRTDQSVLLSEYLHAVLHTNYTRQWLIQHSAGSTMANLNEKILGGLPIPFPPSLSEQKAITQRIEVDQKRLSSLITKTQRSIELLQERRAALITAAVTGQIDLREAA